MRTVIQIECNISTCYSQRYHNFFVFVYVVKVSFGRRSQVADGHLGRAQMSNEVSHWPFRPGLKGPPWSQMANTS